MATQTGLIPFTGTIDNLTGYKVGKKHFLRKKASISPKRFRTDPSFANPRRNASNFGRSILECKAVYYQLPFPLRNQNEIWFPMLREIIQLVRMDTPSSQIFEVMTRKYVTPVLAKENRREEEVKQQPVKSLNRYEPVTEVSLPFISQELPAGRACGPVDSNLLIDQLLASSTLLRKLLSGVEPRSRGFGNKAHKVSQRE